MAWTKQQEQAIYTRGKNILVSAGAGSGKTAVLSERILDACMHGTDIRSILVLTFTNAAALEMKERIRSKLLQNGLFDQANALEEAFITTFDAYSLALVKKYAFELDLSPDIGIMDASLLAVKKQAYLDGLFTELYVKEDPIFLNFLKKYARQNDQNVKEMVLTVMQKLELMVDEEEFVRCYEENYYQEAVLDSFVKAYEALCLKKIGDTFPLFETVLKECENEENPTLYDGFVQVYQGLSSLTAYEDAKAVLNSLTLPRLSSKISPTLKEAKQQLSEALKKVKEDYFSKYTFLKDMKDELLRMKDDIHTILSLALTVIKRLFEYKKSKLLFDYPDIAKMAIRLVIDHPNVHDQVASQFTEILIDEYQDTSDLQETFIQAILNENGYMVGDIKQSIYRFRNANPAIFKKKYDRFSEQDGGIKIDLTANFRSRREVLEDINLLFDDLMSEKVGDADYRNDHRMNYGLKTYETLSQPMDYHMETLTYEPLKEWDEAVTEAFICGRWIQQLMEKRPMVLKRNGFEPLKYSDIAILIDKTKSFPIFKQVFEYLQLPLSIEADMDLNESVLPRLFSNLFTVLHHLKKNQMDTEYRHAIFSVARSFLFSYSDEQIYNLLDQEEDALILLMRQLSAELGQCSYVDLFSILCEKIDIYRKLSLIGDVENSMVVLEYLHRLFETMGTNDMDPDEACAFLKAVVEGKSDLKYKIASNRFDSIHLMTIHKSKGLEFPYCFFPLLSSRFNRSEIKQRYGISQTYGVYLPAYDDENSPTVIKKLAEEEMIQADLSEKVRLLYVALTRAREKFYLVMKNEPARFKEDRFSSFRQLLNNSKALFAYQKEVDLTRLGLSNDYRKHRKIETKIEGEKLVYASFDFSSSPLIKQAISKQLDSLAKDTVKRNLELGKQFHQCLEVLDHRHPDIDALPVSSFMKEVLSDLWQHPLFKEMKKAKTYHEYEFYFEDGLESYHGIIDLFAEYDDHIDIIDYKLSAVSAEEYRHQLAVYQKFVQTVSDKPVACYLLSILKKQLVRVI